MRLFTRSFGLLWVALLFGPSLRVGHRWTTAKCSGCNGSKRSLNGEIPTSRSNSSASAGASEYVEKLTVLWASGEFPDVFYGTRDKRVYVLNGWTKDLTPYFERDKAELDLGDLFPGSVEVWNFDGKQYALPISISGQSMYYNIPKLQEAGLAPPPSTGIAKIGRGPRCASTPKNSPGAGRTAPSVSGASMPPLPFGITRGPSAVTG